MPARPRRTFRRPGASYAGSTPLPLPLVATVCASGVTATTAGLVGSINPQGLNATWWFQWGTTPQFGNVTSTVSLGATSIPQTVEATLTGLTTGTTYWFALTGSTAAGTVTASPIEFVAQAPQAVTNASQPVVSVGTPLVSIPHMIYPFAINPTDGVAVAQQDSYEEILSCVTTVCVCPQGAVPELPTFGIPDLTFLTGPPDTTGLVDAIGQWEPRVTSDVVTTAINGTNADWAVSLNETITGTGQ